MTCPLPVPPAPEVMVIQGTVETAGRSQLVTFVVTLMVPVPPEGPNPWLVGFRVMTHAADWFTVKVAVPTEMVPLRLAPSGLAATLNKTLDGPVPEAGEVTVIQLAFETACHEQLSGVLRLKLPFPPADPIFRLDGLRVYVHTNPDCVIGNVALPTVMEPKRTRDPAFGSTVYSTTPSPFPGPDVTRIQLCVETGVHAQPCGVRTMNEPEVPAAGAVPEVGDTEYEQLAPLWVIVKVWFAMLIVPVRGEVEGFAVTA